MPMPRPRQVSMDNSQTSYNPITYQQDGSAGMQLVTPYLTQPMVYQTSQMQYTPMYTSQQPMYHRQSVGSVMSDYSIMGSGSEPLSVISDPVSLLGATGYPSVHGNAAARQSTYKMSPPAKYTTPTFAPVQEDSSSLMEASWESTPLTLGYPQMTNYQQAEYQMGDQSGFSNQQFNAGMHSSMYDSTELSFQQ